MVYGSVQGHRTMAMDPVRNAAYEAALRACVHEDSVVLDLGAGLGTLGLLAARLGARRVFLVEPSPVAAQTKRIVADQGLADRVEVIPQRIEEATLPEPVDVLTSVMTGNFLLSEDLLPTLFRARDRWLKPGGTLLPATGVMEVAAYSAPRLHGEEIAGWSTPHHGLDLSSCRPLAANAVHYSREEASDLTRLSSPQDLFALDFRCATQTDMAAEAVLTAERAGTCHAIVGWFRMQLGDHWLSTGPEDEAVHWRQAFLPLDPPLQLSAGDRMDISVQRPGRGEWIWRVRCGAVDLKRTSLFAEPVSLAALAGLQPEACPQRSARATRLLTALQAMDGDTSLRDIAAALIEAHPTYYVDAEHALDDAVQWARAYRNT